MDRTYKLFTMIIDLNHKDKDGNLTYKNLLTNLWLKSIRGKDHYDYGSFLGFNIYSWRYRFKENDIIMRLYYSGNDSEITFHQEGISILY